MSVMDSFGNITLQRYSVKCLMLHLVLSVMDALKCYIAKAIHSRHAKVYIKIFRLVSTQHMYESYPSILTTGGLIG